MSSTSLEDQFGLAMEELIRAGLNFDLVAGYTLREVFGDSPYEVFLLKSKSAKQSPSDFLRGLIQVFPPSVIGTLVVLIAKSGMASIRSATHRGQYPQYELLINKLQELARDQTQKADVGLLHDHRQEDELDKLVGHKTD
jgi:hypothetical protein